MSIGMAARCDSPHCTTLQAFSLESPEENGQSILDSFRGAGWEVEGTFTKAPKSVKLRCPYCVSSHLKE